RWRTAAPRPAPTSRRNTRRARAWPACARALSAWPSPPRSGRSREPASPPPRSGDPARTPAPSPPPGPRRAPVWRAVRTAEPGEARRYGDPSGSPVLPLLRNLLVRRRPRLFADRLPELPQRPGQQAGDVHLGDPQGLGDLGLGLAQVEPQVQDPAFAGWQVAQGGGHAGPALERLQDVVLDAQAVGGGAPVLIGGRVERLRR